LVKKINSSDADIVHLHWVQGEMLSISDINKIKKPIIWSLHDMWGFCGAEHISWDNRWKEGYNKIIDLRMKLDLILIVGYGTEKDDFGKNQYKL